MKEQEPVESHVQPAGGASSGAVDSTTGSTMLPFGENIARLLVLLAAVFTYVNTPLNDYCDDGVHIVQRSDKIVAPGGWQAIWTTDYWSAAEPDAPNRDLLYRPVALSTYRLIFQFVDEAAWPQLVFNVLLHAAISLGVMTLARRCGASVIGAMLSGLFFAVMPIHAGVLNNVVGRADLLAALCMLLAILVHLSGIPAGSGRRGSGGTYVRRFAAACLAFLALGSKESGLSVVVMVPLFDLLVTAGRGTRANSTFPGAADGGTAVSSQEGAESCVGVSPYRHGLRVILRAGYLVVPLAVYLVLRANALDGQLFQKPALTKTVNMLVDAPWWQHGLGVVQLWGMYWYKTFWPAVLSVNYSINGLRLATSLLNGYVLAGLAVMLSLAWHSARSWRAGNRAPAFLSIAMLLAYFPTSNSVVLIQVFFAERIWYLPSVFAAILVGMYVSHLLLSRVGWIVVLAILTGMSMRTLIRNSEWQHNGTLYASAYRDFPNAVGACYAFGRWLISSSDDPAVINEGISLLQQAVEIDPGFTDAQRVLGHAYYTLGRYDLAVHHLQIADMQVPGAPKTVAILDSARRGLLQLEGDRLEKIKEAASVAPDDLTAQLAYIDALRRVGLLEEAFAFQQRVDDRFHASARWHHQFAVTYVMRDEPGRALARYRSALELQPDDPRMLLEAAMLLLERRGQGDLKEADKLVTRAEAAAPGASAVMQARAELLAIQGDPAGAVRLLRKAVDALPEGDPQRRLLLNRLRTLGGD